LALTTNIEEWNPFMPSWLSYMSQYVQVESNATLVIKV
jgi:hypothetical protein